MCVCVFVCVYICVCMYVFVFQFLYIIRVFFYKKNDFKKHEAEITGPAY